MPNQSTNVFVSYSRADASLVAPVVKLLRVNKSLVFQDVDGIEPGKRWRGEIARGLSESHLVVVFWCDHASRSDEVSKEWKAAIEQQKDLLPLLLDATPLPPGLKEFQWIDFRGLVGTTHGSISSPSDATVVLEPGKAAAPVMASPLPEAAPVKSSPWFALGGIAAVVVIAAVGLGLFVVTGPKAPPLTSAPDSSQSPPPPPGILDGFDFALGIPLLLGVVIAVTCLVWWSRRRSKREQPIESAAPHRGEIERRIATELEAEILRRTASRRAAARNRQ
jgi:hypothetical protein